MEEKSGIHLLYDNLPEKMEIKKAVTPKVSVIMPVYNARQFVEMTVRSVLRQTFNDFELIIIDDGSSDGSGDICELLAKEDARIRLYRQRNHGICYSRNKAIEAARGKYVAFCDHDDFYEPEYLELLVSVAEKNHADLVKGQYKGIIEYRGIEITNTVMDFLNGECLLETILKDYKYFLRTINVLWNGLYSRTIIEKYNLKFDESFKAGWEDNLFNLEYLKNCSKVYGVNKLIYTHTRRMGQSASLGYNAQRVEDLIKIYRAEATFLKNSYDMVNGRTFMEHQNRFLTALKTELWYPDCPLSKKEKIEKVRMFIEHRIDFAKVSIGDFMLEFREKPMTTIKWLMFHWKMRRLLCAYWNMIGTQKPKRS